MFTKPESIIKELHLPDFQSRNEMLYLLSEFEYGHLPPKPSRTVWKTEKNIIPNFCAGKATLDKITAVCTINNKSLSFPFYVAVPAVKNSNPFFIHINFRNNIPDRYMPTEELIDNGFAVLSFCYGDITADNNDFTSGLAGILYENGKRAPNGAGKLQCGHGRHSALWIMPNPFPIFLIRNAPQCAVIRVWGKPHFLQPLPTNALNFAVPTVQAVRAPLFHAENQAKP